MNIALIHGYPKNGTRNIGDHLILESSKKFIQNKIHRCTINEIFKNEILNKLDELNNYDLICFTGPGIRNKMTSSSFGYPPSFEMVDVPIVNLSCGTSLSRIELEKDIYGGQKFYNEETKKLLRSLDRKSIGWACRGELTYNILTQLGLSVVMNGDIVLTNNDYDDRKLNCNRIKDIAISTPHKENFFGAHFYKLIKKLKYRYCKSNIHIIVHGRADWINYDQLVDFGITVHKVYNGVSEILNIYDKMDIHIGYRVHGHISCLLRKIPSYFFATDGRGIDYMQTLNTGTIFKAWKLTTNSSNQENKNLLKKYLKPTTYQNPLINIVPNYVLIDFVLDMVDRDFKDQFSRFSVVDDLIRNTRKRFDDYIENVISKI